MGNLAIIVSILGFGASTDFTAALLWRLIPSAFISSSIAVRTLVGEAYSQEGQATALGVFNVGASLGFVLGECCSCTLLCTPSTARRYTCMCLVRLMLGQSAYHDM